MKVLAILKVAAFVCVAAALGYWLFADTLRYHLPTDQSTPLKVSFWGPYEEFEMWKEMLANFRRRNPDIPLKMIYVPSRYDQKIQQGFVADAAPDVICYQDEPYPKVLANRKFEDLTPYLQRDRAELGLDPKLPLKQALLKAFWSTAVEVFGRWEGEGDARRWHQYGLPNWGGCNLLFYNKQCFRDARIVVGPVPRRLREGHELRGLVRDAETGTYHLDDGKWTIGEFVHVCKLLTRDFDGDGRIDQFGLAPMYWLYWLPFHMSMGARYLDEPRRHIDFMGPACERSLQLWQDMTYKYHVTPLAAELTMGQGVGFFTGRVAMFCTGPWGMPFLNESKVQYDLLHIPRGSPGGYRATRITWDSVNLFARSKKKEQAWKLIKHLVTLESQKVVVKVQRSIPARREAGPYFVAYNQDVSVHKFVEAADDYAVMQPITEHWGTMASVFSRAFGGLRLYDPKVRMTAKATIGKVYSNKELMELFPPPDEARAKAEEYREIYRQWEASLD